jgi:hypothetical protein
MSNIRTIPFTICFLYFFALAECSYSAEVNLRDSLKTSVYARDLTSELILGVGYKFCPYSENLYNSGSYCIAEYQFWKPFVKKNIRFGAQANFKIFGVIPRQTRFDPDFVEALNSNQTLLTGIDSIYQKAFYRAINFAPDSTKGQLFGSLLFNLNFLKIGNGTLKLGLGLSSVSAVTNINSRFVNNYDPEPIDLTVGSYRIYTAKIAYIINYRKNQFYYLEKIYWRLGLSCQYSDLKQMSFDEVDITRFTTLSPKELSKYGMSFHVTLELLFPIDVW